MKRRMQRQQMARITQLALILCLMTVSISFSATSSSSGFWVEDFMVKLFAMAQNVVIPCVLMGIVLIGGAGIGFRMFTIGPTLGYMLLGAFIVAGGIEALLLMTGSAVASAAVWTVPGVVL